MLRLPQKFELAAMCLLQKKFPKSSSLGKVRATNVQAHEHFCMFLLLQKLFIPASSSPLSSVTLDEENKSADAARKSAFFNFLSSLDATGAPSKCVNSSRGGKKRRRDVPSEEAGAGELGSQSLRLNAGIASASSIASKPNQTPSHTTNTFPQHASYSNHQEYAYHGSFGNYAAFDDFHGSGELHNSRNHSSSSAGQYHQQSQQDFAQSFYYPEQYPTHHSLGYFNSGRAHGHFRQSADMRSTANATAAFGHGGRRSHAQSLGSLHLSPDVARALALQLLPILRDSQPSYSTAPAPADAPVMGGFAGSGRMARPHQAPAPPTGPPEFAHIAGPSDMHLAAELASAVSSRSTAHRGAYSQAGQHRHHDHHHHGSMGFGHPGSQAHTAPRRPRSNSAALDLDLLLQQGGPGALAALASHVQRLPQQAARDSLPNGAMHEDAGRFALPEATATHRFPPSAGHSSSPPRAKHSPVQDRDAAETLRNMAEGSGSESSSRNAITAGDMDTAAL